METPNQPNPYENWHATIDDAKVTEWLSEENLKTKTTRTFEGFEITDSLDGKPDKNIEVSLVTLKKEGQYPQHVHKGSDAYIIVTGGSANFLSGQEIISMGVGDRKDIPRGTPHGFEIEQGKEFQFISVQCPPIKGDDRHEDFELVDMV